MNEIKIVKATKKHKNFLIEANLVIHNVSEQTYASQFAKKLDADYFCENPKFFCLVAEFNKIPVGMILYSKMYWADDGEVLWVSQMYVKKEYRKYGVALKLYESLKTFNKQASVISCATGKNNKIMNQVLSGLGYKIIDMNFYNKKIK